MWRLAAILSMSALVSACATTTGVSPKTVSVTSPRVEKRGDTIVTHTVEKGQTLYRIAKTYGVTVEEVMDANRIDDPRELKVGEVLYVPGATVTRKVEKYDSPEPVPQARPPAVIAVKTPSSPSEPKPPVEKEKKPPKVVKVGKGNGALAWPLRGVLYARFGKKGKELHDGIDLAAPAGLPVKAAAEGNVLFAGEQKGYGLIVIVEHKGGLITLYAHNRDLRVKTGQKIREGQVVATVGDSGRTSGPHLHFEVRKDGVPMDPLDFLGAVPSA
ncbi:MAG: peptidoglycan-binding protein [Archangium gephyra]|uniref:Peptidoglycan-binding protein n=1 Tax=Archangium gephyra TaxID=48 RepID=A0A2W5UWD1_9BACT|nr:MAG: peptidoglycan-binding protein [Archangium gephyra]